MRRSLLVGTTLLLGARLLALTWWYSVNVLFWDQWDLYGAFIDGRSWWALFDWQHGPHRQGIGFWLTWLVANLSGWNARAEAFTIAGVIIGALLVALRIKVLLLGPLTFADALLLVIFLTTAQFETLIGQTNPSHSAVPLLLIILYCLSWCASDWRLRYALVVLLNFLLVFTGFGFFIGLITLPLLLLEVVRSLRAHERQRGMAAGAALLLAFGTLGLFGVDYHFNPAVGCFVFPYQQPEEYGHFVALMFALFIGFQRSAGIGLPLVAGYAVLLLTLALLLYHSARLVLVGSDDAPTSRVIVVLLGFTLLFAANTAIGRVCAGLPFAQSSRYMTLMIPGFFGLYLHIVSSQKLRRQHVMIIMFALALLPTLLPLRFEDYPEIGLYYGSKLAWHDCYLSQHDIAACNAGVPIPIHPDAQASGLERKLAYLEEHHLSLFADQQ